MRHIRPIIVSADKVDELLILSALFKCLIGRDGVSLYVFDKFPNEVTPVALCITFNIRNISGDISREFNLFPRLVSAV